MTAFDMNEDEHILLTEIAEHETRSAATARVILNQVFSENYEVPYEADSTSSRFANNNSNSIESNFDFTIYPNPANTNALLSYSFPSNIVVAELHVSDILGRIVFKYELELDKNNLQINTINYPNGVYQFSLICDGIIIEKEKFSIIH